MKISEKTFVETLAAFLKQGQLVDYESHFDGDDDDKADIELCLSTNRWPQDFPKWLFVEAKSHHSTDAPNTINKIFGQLLKETGKSRCDRADKESALAIAFPSEAGAWKNKKNRQIKMPSGEAYYRQGFLRIDRPVYEAFGELVKAKYVLSFSETERRLRVFDWVGFLDGDEPLVVHTQSTTLPRPSETAA